MPFAFHFPVPIPPLSPTLILHEVSILYTVTEELQVPKLGNLPRFSVRQTESLSVKTIPNAYAR